MKTQDIGDKENQGKKRAEMANESLVNLDNPGFSC